MVVRYWGNKIACNTVIIYNTAENVIYYGLASIVNLVGEVMLGRRLVEYMMSRKLETFLFESNFRRSILKSLSNITSLFSMINFSERDFRYSSIELTLLHIWTSIYASYYNVFGDFLDYFNKNRLQFPFL